MLNQGYVFDQLLDAGYAVCFTEGRMEIEGAYGMERVESTTPPLPAVLDHEDVIATYRYIQEQSFVNDGRIGFFGVSHGGELQMKLISELKAGPAALVPLEPAVIEYLGLQYDGPRTEANLQFNDELDDSQIDFENARRRIQAVDDVAILVGGRDANHLRGLFRKLYDLLDRAGKTVEWASWDHEKHAYQWGPRRTETVADSTRPPSMTGIDARYDVDPLTKETIDRVVSFLNDHVLDD